MTTRLATLLLTLVMALPAHAAVPAFIPYSGRLSDGTAWGQSTTLDLVLTLYDAPTDGTVVFQGKHDDAQVVDGYFTVNLGMCDAAGACDPNPANATFPAVLPPALWLAVSVDGRPDLPRVPVGSVPYAVSAGVAETAGAAIVQKISQSAAVALCASTFKSGNIAAAIPFRTATDTGSSVCSTYGDPGVGKVCKGVVSVVPGDWNYSALSAVDCGGSWTNWWRVYACCDE